MIPPTISPTAAPGERRVFDNLLRDPGADEWIVLHSLELADHVRQVQGEADFVVLAPGLGIVVLEVKSHAKVQRSLDGMWHMGQQTPTSKSPFKQASDAMFSVRKFLEEQGIGWSYAPMVSAVWFTNARAHDTLAASAEWHPWQMLDRTDFKAGTARAVEGVLKSGYAHLSSKAPSACSKPSNFFRSVAETVAAGLRPRFEISASPADVRRDREEGLAAFLEEQYQALDSMTENDRVLFLGPAGSGKTFLAMEAARREVAAGRSGYLLCFNKFLGVRLRADVSPSDRLVVGTLHAFLRSVAGVTPPADPDAEFWRGLVDTATERLLDGDHARDFVIVDEMQDLASGEEFLDALDLMVTGGLAGGRCLFFGDFEKQALYGSADGRAILRARVPDLAAFKLTSNCRNRPRIGSVVEVLARMKPGFARYRREDDGAPPSYLWYESPNEQQDLLERAVEALRTDGFDLDEIVVLSPKRYGSAAAKVTAGALKQVLTPDDGGTPSKGRLRYATVHSYKGLEAPAVVLTDIDEASGAENDALLYVGLTRATDRLIVIGNKASLQAKLGGQP